MLCPLELNVECQAKLREKGIDLHRIFSNHNAAYPLVTVGLECLTRSPSQDVHVAADWQVDGGNAPAKQGALDSRAGHDLCEHHDEIVEQRGTILTTTLGKYRGDAGGFE